MAIQVNTNAVCIPKGRVYFAECDDQGVLSEYEVYVGLSDDLTVNVATEELEIESSECGFNTVIARQTVGIDRTATLTIKECSDTVTGYFIIGTPVTYTQAAAAGLSHAITSSLQGTYIQIGTSATALSGARALLNVAIAGYVEGVDYDVDLETGRVYIRTTAEGGTIVDGTALTISYDLDAATWTEICTDGTRAVQGALRFVSCNAAGEERDWYMRSVQLNPNGDFVLKQEDSAVQTMSFSVSINDPTDGTPAICTTLRPE